MLTTSVKVLNTHVGTIYNGVEVHLFGEHDWRSMAAVPVISPPSQWSCSPLQDGESHTSAHGTSSAVVIGFTSGPIFAPGTLLAVHYSS
jgi:hypothetical protein